MRQDKIKRRFYLYFITATIIIIILQPSAHTRQTLFCVPSLLCTHESLARGKTSPYVKHNKVYILAFIN